MARPLASALGAPSMTVSSKLPPKELQELWFSTRKRSWSTLAVIATNESSWGVRIAEGLRDVAELTGRRARTLRGNDLSLGDIASLVINMQVSPADRQASSVWTSSSARPSGPGDLGDEILLVALPSVASNPLVLPAALAAEAVLLVVELGHTELESARHTVELVGRDRLIGCVLVRDR